MRATFLCRRLYPRRRPIADWFDWLGVLLEPAIFCMLTTKPIAIKYQIYLRENFDL